MGALRCSSPGPVFWHPRDHLPIWFPMDLLRDDFAGYVKQQIAATKGTATKRPRGTRAAKKK
jgi:hypothetical protein